MKHNPKATANALAIVGGGIYLICAVWTLLARSSFMVVMNTWTHGIELSALPTRTLDLGTLLIGFITFVLAAWISGYAFVVIYNKFT